MIDQPIASILVDRGLITKRDRTQALALQEEVGGLVGQALLRLGAITEEQLLGVLAEQLDLAIIEPADLPADPDTYRRTADRLGLAPRWFVARRCAAWFNAGDEQRPLPTSEQTAPARGLAEPDTAELCVIATDPLNLEMRESIEAALRRLKPMQTDEDAAIEANISETNSSTASPMIRYFLTPSPTLDMCLGLLEKNTENFDDDALADTARLREMAEEAPVIDFVNTMLAGALKDNASDIHIEAFEHSFVVRYRIDGVLHTRRNESRARFDAIASRVKLIAGMDIAEQRLPQDGRHSVRFAGNDIDLRVSSVPSTWGESLVIRLLRKQAELPNLEGLGLTGRSSTTLSELLTSPNGIILVTGPTGSGKSTTLYRGLEQINDGFRKIITIEDPVEYDVEGIPQIQVKPDIGYTFASGLRAILRQDPDVIMVGEIRDGETATIAAQAALTGHLVLSTLHTNSALAAITRLEDIGLERFLISASVRGLIAQRLVRRLCPHCETDGDPAAGDALCRQAVESGAHLGEAMEEPARWRRAVGCDACDHTGYKGRIAVFEVAKLDDTLRDGINAGATLRELFTKAREQGFLTLFEDGLIKARDGQTTLSEIYRVCGSDIA